MQLTHTQGVYLGQESAKIHSTLALLRHFKAFQASGAKRMADPMAGFGHYLDRGQAACKLRWLIHVAINRKAGVPDVPGRKHTTDYQARLYRDVRRVRDNVNARVVIHQFETQEIAARFGHLLSTEWEE